MSKFELITLSGYDDIYESNTMRWERIELEAASREDVDKKGLEVAVAMASKGSLPEQLLLVEVLDKDEDAWAAALKAAHEALCQKAAKENEQHQRSQYEALKKIFEDKT